MHTVRALLIPDDSNLPASAAARGPGEDSTAETEVEAVTSKDLPGARTAASNWCCAHGRCRVGFFASGALLARGVV